MNNLAYAKQKLLQESEAYKIYQDVLKVDPGNKTAKKQVAKLDRMNATKSKNIIYKKGF